MKKLSVAFSLLVISLLCIGSAHANHLSGYVYCDVNNDGSIDSSDTPLAGVTITATGTDGYTDTTNTDTSGYYGFGFPGTDQTYTLTIGGPGLPQDSIVVLPAPPYSFTFGGGIWQFEVNWLISSQTCRTVQTGACWLTAGGVKFDSVLGFKAAQGGPKFSFGGNTFPGCSPTAGDGGQWNFVDHQMKIHFQGWQVDQVTCGNVAGIPPGSTSPPTPFNFIEFSGWGTIKGIAGNKGPFAPKYYFVVRAEDRNEPGNEKALLPDGGDMIDRIFLRVFTNTLDPLASTTYMIGTDDNPPSAIGVPLTITGGNIQIHISSCP